MVTILVAVPGLLVLLALAAAPLFQLWDDRASGHGFRPRPGPGTAVPAPRTPARVPVIGGRVRFEADSRHDPDDSADHAPGTGQLAGSSTNTGI